MIRINRKIEYALMALRHLQLTDGACLVTAKDLSERYQVPFDLISKVLQKMAHEGILESEQGARGGYRLAVNLDELSFFKLSVDILGPMQFAYCLHHSGVRCQLAQCCNVISPVVSLSNRIEALLRNITVGELLEAKEPDEQDIRIRAAAENVAREGEIVWK